MELLGSSYCSSLQFSLHLIYKKRINALACTKGFEQPRALCELMMQSTSIYKSPLDLACFTVAM